MSRFEILKSNTIQFTIELNKSKLSDAVLEEILKIDTQLAKSRILHSNIDDKNSLKELKAFLSEHKKKLGQSLYEYCIIECREIKDDLEFSKTETGQFIIQLEDWVQFARKEIGKLKNVSLFVGRSFLDPKELIIGGVVESFEKVEEIKQYFNGLKPPVDPKYLFEEY